KAVVQENERSERFGSFHHPEFQRAFVRLERPHVFGKLARHVPPVTDIPVVVRRPLFGGHFLVEISLDPFLPADMVAVWEVIAKTVGPNPSPPHLHLLLRRTASSPNRQTSLHAAR